MNNLVEMAAQNKKELSMLEQLKARKADYEKRLVVLEKQISILEQNPFLEDFIQNLKNI